MGISFTIRPGDDARHEDFIKQDSPDEEYYWNTFIIDQSQGFTRSGVQQQNASTRTYLWALPVESLRRVHAFLHLGTAFDAQNQFLANLEDAVSSSVDLPSAISRYQDVLQFAGLPSQLCLRNR